MSFAQKKLLYLQDYSSNQFADDFVTFLLLDADNSFDISVSDESNFLQAPHGLHFLHDFVHLLQDFLHRLHDLPHPLLQHVLHLSNLQLFLHLSHTLHFSYNELDFSLHFKHNGLHGSHDFLHLLQHGSNRAQNA